MTVAYIYTLEGCEACERVEHLLSEQGYDVREVPINNPLVEAGVRMLFKDSQLVAPVVVIQERGIYVMSEDEPPVMLRIANLKLPAGIGAT